MTCFNDGMMTGEPYTRKDTRQDHGDASLAQAFHGKNDKAGSKSLQIARNVKGATSIECRRRGLAGPSDFHTTLAVSCSSTNSLIFRG